MMVRTIRETRPNDHQPIHALLEQAFQNPGEAQLVDALRKDGDMALEMVTQADGEIIGHVAFSTLLTPARTLALAPLSVAPSYHNQGIGTELMNNSLQHLRGKSWKAVFVLGAPNYYQRFGFDLQAARAFSSIYSGDHFMVLELEKNWLEGRQSDVRYASAFGMLT